MALTREEKKKIIGDLKTEIDRQKIMIFANFKGLKVNDFFALRKKLKKVDAKMSAVKKTLLKMVLREKGLKINDEKLKGEIALIWGYNDQISPAKALYEFSQQNKNLKILGAFFENEFRETNEVITLAQIPPKEVLLANLVRSIAAPISNFVNVLQGNLRNLVYILSQIKPST